ncbi:MAG: hypothetical protein HQL38_08405 [Alphaproteobacteria bacterium]|nr:hypothetical protein [Alphaproteobacteria bacterium]
MLETFDIDVMVRATAYARATSYEDALNKVHALAERTIYVGGSDQIVSALPADHPELPAIRLSPEMTIHGPWNAEPIPAGPILPVIAAVVSQADAAGCDGDLIVTSHSAIIALKQAADPLRDVLQRAADFIAGFEDDETQEGVSEMLDDLRRLLGTTGAPGAGGAR